VFASPEGNAPRRRFCEYLEYKVHEAALLDNMVRVKSLCHAEQQREIAARLQIVSEKHKPLWGRMNAGAMLRHQLQAFEVALQERPVRRLERFPLRGPHGRWLAFYSGLPWSKGFRTVPEIDILLKAEAIGDFDAEKSALVEIFDRFCCIPADNLLPEHPFFGRMSYDDWMRWGYLHPDHHLRQFGC
jgi:hypothetical protein